jgi:P22_AR N-terminal domain
VRSLCSYFDVSAASQLAALQQHKVLSRYLRMFTMQTKGGRQPTWCIKLKAVPLWVIGLDLDEVRPELQEDLIQWAETLLEISYRVFGQMPFDGPLSALQAMFVPEITSDIELATLREEVQTLRDELRTQRQSNDALFHMVSKRLANVEHAIQPHQQYDVEGGPDEPEG